MDAISKVPMAVIPTGGQREIPAAVGELFLQQIEMFTLRSALEINKQGDVVEQGDVLATMWPPAPMSVCDRFSTSESDWIMSSPTAICCICAAGIGTML